MGFIGVMVQEGCNDRDWIGINKMRKYLRALFYSLIACLFSTACFSDFIKAEDIQAIQNQLAYADQRTLVIFDVDDVLFEPNDQILKAKNKAYLQVIREKLSKKLTRHDTDVLDSIIFKQRTISPVDPKMKDLIDIMRV